MDDFLLTFFPLGATGFDGYVLVFFLIYLDLGAGAVVFFEIEFFNDYASCVKRPKLSVFV